MSYTAAELEVIGLCVALEAIGDIANHALLDVPRTFEEGAEIEVRFKSREHQHLFLIRLLDFAKEGGDASLTGVKGSCLDVLLAACRTRSFDEGGSVAPLQQAVTALHGWLDAEIPHRMSLPSLGLDVQLTLTRAELLYIIGNHAKHNLARLTGLSRRIKELLARNGYAVEIEQIPLALEDFREHLQEDYFVYYSTWLAELVNNLRWAIQDYLQPTFQRAFTRDSDERYSYTFPALIVHDVPKEWFWRLMNSILARPYIGRFVGSRYLRRDVLRA